MFLELFILLIYLAIWKCNTNWESPKGQIKSEWIYEIINFPKYQLTFMQEICLLNVCGKFWISSISLYRTRKNGTFGLKNSWNHIIHKLKWIYFRRVLAIWNHCGPPPELQLFFFQAHHDAASRKQLQFIPKWSSSNKKSALTLPPNDFL